MADVDLVATGIAGLDPLFFGGIRRGNLVLVKGEPGSGKTILGTEFIYRGATRYGEPGLIVVFESNPVFLRRDAASLGWDLDALEQNNSLKIIATSPQVLNQELRATSVFMRISLNGRRLKQRCGSPTAARINSLQPWRTS